jgi:hypothetical protein
MIIDILNIKELVHASKYIATRFEQGRTKKLHKEELLFNVIKN